MFPQEHIPDQDAVFYRVHKDLLKSGPQPHPGCFRETPAGSGELSVDWSKYSTPVQTRAGGAASPESYGILELEVAKIRQIENLAVIHDPQAGNRAHTAVRGLGTTKSELRTMQRALLLDACGERWKIAPG